MTQAKRCLVLAVFFAILPGIAHAYVGPGAGLGMLGSLIAVVAAVLVALFGLIMFPIMMIRKKRRKQSAEGIDVPAADTGKPD